ncbi:MAG: DNA helicase PcrA [Limnochordia bacterium]|jgi:DNA helicase-2/ATP-dependent DNA helicase PcrA
MDLSQLNTAQREAVLHGEGPLLILAGAGSGKTRVLTYRIGYLLRERGVAPGEILAVTFTNKAAREMKERLLNLVGPRAQDLWIGTFHSICVRFLRWEGHYIGIPRDFLIYDSADQLQVIKDCLGELNLDPKRHEPRSILRTISNAKNELVSPADFSQGATDYWDKVVARVYVLYQEKLKANGGLDFDDLIMETVNLFRQQGEVLEKYQGRFRHILVDEYQDTNHAQYVLVNLLAQAHGNLFVVGDEDQGIYGFRGADIRNILNFERDYPNSRVIKLELNYRSTQRILDAANSVISNNLERKHKSLWTENPPGDPIILHQAPDERGEAAFIAGEINRLTNQGRSLREMAVLYRTHALSRAVEEELIQRNIPYRIVAGLRFYERKEVKDLMAYLRFLANQDDSFSLRRIINTPTRGIGEATLARVEEYAFGENITLWGAILGAEAIPELGTRARNALVAFRELVQELLAAVGSLSLSFLTQEVLVKTNYLAQWEKDPTPEARARVENLQEFMTVVNQFEQENPGQDLTAFLEHLALVADVDTYDENADAVTLMSLHAAKGLEFPVVFLIGMEDGLFPHNRCFYEPDQLEEERRLCYVGITRAQERLYFTYTMTRTLYGRTTPSRLSQFVNEIPPELLQGSEGEERDRPRKRPSAALGANGDYQAGDRVLHAKFGPGTVVAVQGSGSDQQVTVAFPDLGLKVLLAAYAPLEKV